MVPPCLVLRFYNIEKVPGPVWSRSILSPLSPLFETFAPTFLFFTRTERHFDIRPFHLEINTPCMPKPDFFSFSSQISPLGHVWLAPQYVWLTPSGPLFLWFSSLLEIHLGSSFSAKC